MKKLIPLLLLFAAVIFSAGCVATEDPAVGLWEGETKYAPPLIEETVVCKMMLNADGSGYSVTEAPGDWPDTSRYVTWEKKDGIYAVDRAYVYTKDGENLRNYQGDLFVKEGNSWVREDEYFTNVLTFNEDGAGTYELMSKLPDDEPDTYQFVWKQVSEDKIAMWYSYPYEVHEDGSLEWKHFFYQKTETGWVYTTEHTSIILVQEGDYLMSYYDEVSGNPNSCYEVKENGDGTVTLILHYISFYEMNEEGMLENIHTGETFSRAAE